MTIERAATATAEQAVDTEEGKATIAILRPWYLVRPMDDAQAGRGKKFHQRLTQSVNVGQPNLLL